MRIGDEYCKCVLQFSLLNGALHDSLCEGMLADSTLELDQVRQCEVLTANKQVSTVQFCACPANS